MECLFIRVRVIQATEGEMRIAGSLAYLIVLAALRYSSGIQEYGMSICRRLNNHEYNESAGTGACIPAQIW